MARKYLFILFAALLLLPVISLSNGTGDHPPNDLVFQQTGAYGVVYDTIPNWLTTSLTGTFNIEGIPTGSQVVEAFLYLNAVEVSLAYQGAGGSFGSCPTLPWKYPANYTDDLHLSDWDYWCTGYRWDVTQCVTGDGTYSVDLRGPWACLSAFLVVVYEDQSLAQSMVSITMGEEILMSAGTAPETSVVSIPNIVAGSGARLILFGESLWSVGPEMLAFNSNSANVDVFSGLGQVFDAGNLQTINGTNTVALSSLIDLLLWKIVVLVSPPGGQNPTAKIEAKLDRGLPKIDVIESKLDDDFPQVNSKIDAVERKIDGLGGLNIDEVLGNIAKLEAKADALEAKVDPVNDQLQAIEGKFDQRFGDFSFSNMESKIDQMGGDLTGGLHYLNQIATAASIDKIETKLDQVGPDINRILWDQEIGLPGVHNSIAYVERKLDSQDKEYMWMLKYLYTTQATIVVAALNKAEEKLDGLGTEVYDILYSDRGLLPIADNVVKLESKLDSQTQEVDRIIYDTYFGLMSTHAQIAQLESKLDSMPGSGWFGSFEKGVYSDLDKVEAKLDRGVQPGIETIIKMLGAQATAATLAMIEAKLDKMEPEVDNTYRYSLDIPYIYTLEQTNTSLLNGIEAKIDGSGGLQDSLSEIQGTLNDTVAGGLSSIEAKLDAGGGTGGTAELETKLDTIGPKIDNINTLGQEASHELTGVEQKLLNELLRPDQECLPPMAYTPYKVGGDGAKLEEVMWFVRDTLANLEFMGYITHDSQGWADWNAGYGYYGDESWSYAGWYFWQAYAWAESYVCPGAPIFHEK